MVKSLQELQQLIRICRKSGVDSIKVGDLELCFGSAPTKTNKASTKRQLKEFSNYTADPTIATPDELPPEALLFWSSDDKLGAQESI
jgi:hypothetical protein